MTLIAHSDLPTFLRLKQEGQEVLAPSDAKSQDIRELHVGIMNMMPDAVLEATERQFLRLIGSSNRIVQFYVHLFSPTSIVRTGKAKEHVAKYYEDFAKIKKAGLDALIITGANPAQKQLSQEPFWDEFIEVIDWAKSHVCSIMCSCLATHAIFELLYKEQRTKLPQKRWGVYSHKLINNHPLVNNMNTKFDAAHSHLYEVSSQQAHNAGVIVLATSKIAGLHIATSKDFRFVFCQGHPEYDTFSLLKEYKREVLRALADIRDDYPVFPDNYLNQGALDVLGAFKIKALKAKSTNSTLPEFPEDKISELLDNTWVDTGKSLFNNWLGLVYKLTAKNRHEPLMPHLDKNNPLNL